MQEILDDLDRWQRDGEELALATLVRVRRSAPRLPGARLLMTRSGKMAGSVSGGCVEADVFEHATRVLDSGEPMIASYGISDEQGFDIGLSCGGEIDVLIEPLAVGEVWAAVRKAVDTQRPAALALGIGPDALAARALAIEEDATVGSIDPELDERVVSEARAAMREGVARVIALPWQDGEAEVFIDVFSPAPRLYIVGATQVAIPLASLAREVGFRITVVDARSMFATEERFPGAEVLSAWPDAALAKHGLDEQTYVVVLTHDPKFDLPVLEVALRSSARYIGAMGSRKTHARRVEQLRKQGFSDKDLARIRAPIGLDLGGQQPEELALAILAEMVAARHGRELSVTEVE